MKPLRIFRHLPTEGAGYLATFLARHGIPFETIAIDAGDRVPHNLDHAGGLVFMGGTMSVNDPLPWIAAEIDLIRLAMERDLPVLGHCLGGQLIAKALGASISANPVKEVGWLAVERHDNATARDWLGDLPETFEAFHWHGETFTLPPDAAPVLRSRYCEQQGFVKGKALALQFHVEMTIDMVLEWLDVGAAYLQPLSDSVQGAGQMTENLDRRIAALQARADVIYSRWLRGYDSHS